MGLDSVFLLGFVFLSGSLEALFAPSFAPSFLKWNTCLQVTLRAVCRQVRGLSRLHRRSLPLWAVFPSFSPFVPCVLPSSWHSCCSCSRASLYSLLPFPPYFPALPPLQPPTPASQKIPHASPTMLPSMSFAFLFFYFQKLFLVLIYSFFIASCSYFRKVRSSISKSKSFCYVFSPPVIIFVSSTLLSLFPFGFLFVTPEFSDPESMQCEWGLSPVVYGLSLHRLPPPLSWDRPPLPPSLRKPREDCGQGGCRGKGWCPPAVVTQQWTFPVEAVGTCPVTLVINVHHTPRFVLAQN